MLRGVIAALAGFLILNGTIVLLIALVAPRTGMLRGVIGGAIAIASGVIALRAVYRKQGPEWLLSVLENVD